MSKSDWLPPDESSKTQVKNEMLALQKMGEKLVRLAESQLDQIPLPDKLREAIRVARTLKTHESIRRQMQYIGKLMRHIDVELIQKALDIMQLGHEKKTAEFHAVEEWRERLLNEGDAALHDFMASYPTADRQALRQLMRNAKRDRVNNKNTGGEKALFRYLSDWLQSE